MALQGTDLLIVQRDQQSYKMPASEIASFVPPAPNVGDGTITIVQPGTTNQTFTVNQSGDTTITLKNDNDNTEYTAGNGLQLSGTVFSAKAADSTITIDSSGIKVNTSSLPSDGVTSITPGEGIRNGSTVGGPNSTAITSTGSLSVDNTVVRTSGNQTIAGVKEFTSQMIVTGIKSAVPNIPNGGAWDLVEGNLWQTSAVIIDNPTNAQAGITGLIYFNATPTTWGSNFKFPGDTVPDIPPHAIVPYYIRAENEICIGFPTGTYTP